MPNGKKHKRHKMSTHKRKKRLRKGSYMYVSIASPRKAVTIPLPPKRDKHRISKR